MTDKNKPPPRSRQQRLLDVLNAPPSKEMVDLLNPNSPSNRKAVAEAKTLLTAPPSEEALAALKGSDEEFAKLKELLRPSTNTKDTLDPGEEFVEPTAEDLLKKPALSEMEILLAPPSEETLAALRIGVLKSKDGSDSMYLHGRSLDNLLMSGKSGFGSFDIKTFRDAQREIADKYIGMIQETPSGELHPGLVKRMQKDPEVALYVNYTIEAGRREGLNGTMLANQFWMESRFNPDAVSNKGAAGISQIMPYHQGSKYGLMSQDDFFDPYKSIDAGAKFMREKTEKFKDQRLALIAYNGGEGAIDFVEQKLGKRQITYADWHGFIENRRTRSPSNDPSAWQNETYKYVQEIAGKPAPEERLKTSGPELSLTR